MSSCAESYPLDTHQTTNSALKLTTSLNQDGNLKEIA